MAARALRVAFLYANPSAFVALACAELRDGVAKHGRVGCRLNTFSDIPWEKVCPWLLSIPGVVFYDYTKNWARRSSPSYRLTYSASERTAESAIVARVGEGENVAVVFAVRRGCPLPATYLGCRVVDGDASDARHADPTGVIVGLRAKGRMVGSKMSRVV